MVNKIKTYWVHNDEWKRISENQDLRDALVKTPEKIATKNFSKEYIQVLKLSEVKENFLEKSFIKNELSKFENFQVLEKRGRKIYRIIPNEDWFELKERLGL